MIHRRVLLTTLLASTAFARVAAAAPRRPARPPNIVTIVLDDVGFSDLGCFGAEIRTPNMDRLASRGLRYNRFDTKAVCSTTRAAMFTGRNGHTVNMADVPDVGMVAPPGSFPKTAFHIPENAQNMAQALKGAGYANWIVGKWHLIPKEQLGEGTARGDWPLQRGFDYFYGFARGWTDQYKPDLVENNGYIHPKLPADYHLSSDLVDKSIALIGEHRGKAPDQPFFLHLGLGVAHAPLQVPARYSDGYKGVYDKGWDEIRRARFERLKQLGVIPPDTALPPANDGDRPWSELSADEKVIFARYMEVYAGFMEHADEQIGRLLATLDDNTIVVLFSDNGAASEAGQAGEFNGLYRPNTLAPAEQLARLAQLGTAETQAAYPRPWAMAGVTPFRRYKLWPYQGGVRTPLIISWPAKIKDGGAVRRQFVDVIDIAPTLLEAAGTKFAEVVDGQPQLPVAGRSFGATFTNPKAPAARTTQFFELRGNRAITDGGWRAVAMHKCGSPFDEDRWELFNIDVDYSESVDLAQRHPEVLARMQRLWAQEWERYGSGPMLEPSDLLCRFARQFNE
ncbi:sulfatase [Phenylobacterium sp. Root77]|uniref:arylsulfatase n=1 Tax=unclassified Phenylobacterium TaxID=2640670 RepID=UPI0006FD677C|nr:MULTISPECIES: arylsulfatase [unclassified Phenylobacterium]KQW70416.1 sulfatase [Phenylobacterium sp. Root1277]KQW91163.1 sulfatase [Phenylobacterium sp. Root1290]KRC39201.1 sulfatase [Phenylobacterium sp. Root77]